MKNTIKNNSRSTEIVNNYFSFLDAHLKDIIDGKSQEFLTLKKISAENAISYQHLTNTVKKQTGHHPCYFYETKILEEAKKMLIDGNQPPAEVAKTLMYDPSNFSKFFKRWTGKTPGQFKKIRE